MLRTKAQKPAILLALGLLLATSSRSATGATSIQLSGALAGLVTDSSGTPQMGAAVLLLNRQDRICSKITTDEHGAFVFLGLLPDVYSIRVTLASYVPALRRDILVQPGMRSVLNVNLNTLFSSIQVMYPQLENGSVMTDAWKWVLRSASTTRPVLRFTEADLARTSPNSGGHDSVFTDTRGVLRLSAGGGSATPGTASEADIGTAFALATSVFGNNEVEVSGNLGYGSQTGVPAAAFRTSYRRSGSAAEASVTMRQLLMPGRLESSVPMLRSITASYDDRLQLSDSVSLQYGMSMDSLSFLGHLSYFSPYARLNYSFGDFGDLSLAYTSGNARPDLGGYDESDLQDGLSTLGMFPRISMRDGRARVQRGEEFELTYTRKIGSRKLLVSASRESVSNAALSLVAPAGLLDSADLLPDLFSGNSTFNAGNYQSLGYTVGMTQNFGQHVSATVSYGSMGALTVDNRELVSQSPDDLRSMIRAGRRHAATARIDATAPWTGTRLIASYQATPDDGWSAPGRLYSTQSLRALPGLNIYVRQPIPGPAILPWRMELTADFRNMLAEGYLPLNTGSEQTVLLVPVPRSFRGGLSFIF
jgi:hypothetical protein